jgi:PII-like signaling protein
MNRSGQATWLRIYIGESDQWHHKPLYQALVEFFREEGVAGATVLRGVEGYGAHSQIHAAHILRLSEDLPMIVEVIDEPARIEALLPTVREMVRDGLIMTSSVNVEMYGHHDQTPAHERTE